jgi:deoxyhypusine synthase
MKIGKNAKASEIINEMSACGVLGAGRTAKATELLSKFFTDPEYTVFLTLAGPAVPGGLRSIISDLIKRKSIEVIVSNGANITHDVLESLGCRPIQGKLYSDDIGLMKRGLGRVGDIYIDQEDFKKLEKKVYAMLDVLMDKGKNKIALFELLKEFGQMFDDKNSVLMNAARENVPIFSPGFFDSMLGLHIWTYSQLKKIQIDQLADMGKMMEVIFNAKKIGVIILGGGVPKHFTLGASMLRGGVDAAIQITMDRPEAGSLSGAVLEEAISWKKAKAKSNLVTVISDFTIVFPLMVAAALENV